MLKNIMKDLEKYARWQVFFFLLCLCDICHREGQERERVAFRYMEGVRGREMMRKESGWVNIIKVFYMHGWKHQNKTYFVSTHTNTVFINFLRL